MELPQEQILICFLMTGFALYVGPLKMSLSPIIEIKTTFWIKRFGLFSPFTFEVVFVIFFSWQS